MSFALTTPQVRDRSKTVTRRMGWESLKPGDQLQPIVKGQGLKKGTTGIVAIEEGRSFVGIELSKEYVSIARERLADVAPLLSREASALLHVPSPASEAFVCGMPSPRMPATTGE